MPICPGRAVDLLSPSKSWQLYPWQKSRTSGQAVLCSVNESQHQACTDHTRNQRDPQQRQREEHLLLSLKVTSVNGSGKRRTWKFLYNNLHSSIGVRSGEMLNCGCFSHCSGWWILLLLLFSLLSCACYPVLTNLPAFPFQAVFPHQDTRGHICDPIFLKSAQDTQLHALKNLCIWKTKLHWAGLCCNSSLPKLLKLTFWRGQRN